MSIPREVEELRTELLSAGGGGGRGSRGRSLLPNLGLATPPTKKDANKKKRVTIAVERYKVEHFFYKQSTTFMYPSLFSKFHVKSKLGIGCNFTYTVEGRLQMWAVR
jgi:hypothetical protein